MRLYVFLILASCALHARAATVPKVDVADIQKKLAAVAQEAAKKEILPLQTPSIENELTEQEISVNEVQNNLKRGNIPVKVVVEDVKPAVVEKLDDVSLDDGTDIKRLEIDLKNPGPPQRQEHETQNPEHFEEPAISIKQTVDSAQAALKQGFQGVSQGIQDWVANNEQFNNIQQGIQSLQDNFKEQLSKLNQTVQSFFPKPDDPVVEPVDPPQKKAAETVQVSLKTLENSFQRTVQTLNEGVQAYALLPPTLRQAAEGAAGGGTAGGAGSGGSQSNNIFVQYLQALQSTISQGFANVTTAIQNTLNVNGSGNESNNTFAGAGSIISGIGSGIQNIFASNGQPAAPAAGAQSDEGTTPRPNWPILQSIQSSLQNILNPGQNQAQNGQASQPAPPGPIAQAIQNNPIVQAVGNFIQPNRPGAQQPAIQPPAGSDAQPSQPAESAQSADAQPAEAVQEGTNVVPASDSKPQSTEQKQPEVVDGPIKKIIQNNPIMKGISGAVQRIQAMGNPDQPRDTLAGETTQQEKGHYGYGGHGGGDGGANTGNSDNSNSSGQVAKSESPKVPESAPKVPESAPKVPESAPEVSKLPESVPEVPKESEKEIVAEPAKTE